MVAIISFVHNPLAAADLGVLKRYLWLGSEPVNPEFEWAAEVIYYKLAGEGKIQQFTTKVSLASLISVYCVPDEEKHVMWPGLIDDIDRIARTAEPAPLRERLLRYLNAQVMQPILPMAVRVSQRARVPLCDYGCRTWTCSWWAASPCSRACWTTTRSWNNRMML